MQILARLGFISTSNCSDATHFVTDSFVRTRNMLEAIACGKPIVTHLWLESCGRANCSVDEKSYILRDAKKERELGFNMAVSLAHARKHPLLEVCVYNCVTISSKSISCLGECSFSYLIEEYSGYHNVYFLITGSKSHYYSKCKT